MVQLKHEDTESDDKIFEKTPMFRMTISPSLSIIEFKQRFLDLYNEKNPDN